MLCVKCHKNNATVHFITVREGKVGHTICLCTDCASACGLPPQDSEQWSAIWEEQLGRMADQILGEKKRPDEDT